MKRTVTEGQLANLARKASLSLWSYPSPFRDQGNARGGDGKEIADLLIVFGDHIVVFSDKACDFPIVPDLRVAWGRWFRAAVLGAAKQLRGGMRWIRDFPARVFADKACSKPLAVDLTSIKHPIFHLVAIVHDGTGRRATLTGGSGSLVVDPGVVGDSQPLHVGRIGAGWPLVHVWDEATFGIILGHLDTVPDLLDYLIRREELLNSGRLVIAGGEEDLLTTYLTHIDDSGSHAFPGGTASIAVPPGEWPRFTKSPEYRAYKGANAVSYFWDDLVDRTIGHSLAGTSVVDTTGGDVRVLEGGFRIMASERRVTRRNLCIALFEALESHSGIEDLYRTIPWIEGHAASYVFLICPRRSGESESDYRHRRGVTIRIRMEWSVAKGLVTEKRPIVGIAIDAGAHKKSAGHSEDVVTMEIESIDDAWRAERLSLGEQCGWGRKLVPRKYSTQEYPVDRDRTSRKTGRNEICPCGSGIKFKRCCGRS